MEWPLFLLKFCLIYHGSLCHDEFLYNGQNMLTIVNMKINFPLTVIDTHVKVICLNMSSSLLRHQYKTLPSIDLLDKSIKLLWKYFNVTDVSKL